MKLIENEDIQKIYGHKLFGPIHGWPTKLRDLTLHCKLYLREKKNLLKYGNAVPQIFDTILVNPSDIEKFSGRKVPPDIDRYEDIGKVKSGNWDRINPEQFIAEIKSKDDFRYNYLFAQKFTETEVFKSIRDHFKKDVNWEETSYYKMCEKASKPKYDNLKKLKETDELYHSIKTEGFKSKLETDDHARIREYLDDVMVDLDRNGSPLFVDGRHRLSIAKILDLEEIPVRVVCRHEKWQKKRIQAVETPDKLSNKELSHPDIRNLIK